MNPVPPTRALIQALTSPTFSRPGSSSARMSFIPILAHQGGWDEALLVGLPLAAIGLLLWVANRRVSAQLAAASETTERNDAPDHRAGGIGTARDSGNNDAASPGSDTPDPH